MIIFRRRLFPAVLGLEHPIEKSNAPSLHALLVFDCPRPGALKQPDRVQQPVDESGVNEPNPTTLHAARNSLAKIQIGIHPRLRIEVAHSEQLLGFRGVPLVIEQIISKRQCLSH